jgi:hypothetical protein
MEQNLNRNGATADDIECRWESQTCHLDYGDKQTKLYCYAAIWARDAIEMRSEWHSHFCEVFRVWSNDAASRTAHHESNRQRCVVQRSIRHPCYKESSARYPPKIKLWQDQAITHRRTSTESAGFRAKPDGHCDAPLSRKVQEIDSQYGPLIRGVRLPNGLHPLRESRSELEAARSQRSIRRRYAVRVLGSSRAQALL